MRELAGGADEEVGLGHLGRVQARGDRVLVDVARVDALLDQPPRGLDDLRAAAVVEGDPELEALVGRRRLLEPLDLGEELGLAAVAPADEARAHALAGEVGQLALDRLDEDLHERVDLVGRARPVLGREGVHAERLDAEVDRGLDRAPERARPGAVAGGDGQAGAAAPSGRSRP